MVFRAAASKVPTPTTHRTVTVHLRLTLKAFSLSKLIALCVQSTGLAVCTCKYLAEPGGNGTNEPFFLHPLGTERVASNDCTNGRFYLSAEPGWFGLRVGVTHAGIISLVWVRLLLRRVP